MLLGISNRLLCAVLLSKWTARNIQLKTPSRRSLDGWRLIYHEVVPLTGLKVIQCS